MIHGRGVYIFLALMLAVAPGFAVSVQDLGGGLYMFNGDNLTVTIDLDGQTTGAPGTILHGQLDFAMREGTIANLPVARMVWEHNGVHHPVQVVEHGLNASQSAVVVNGWVIAGPTGATLQARQVWRPTSGGLAVTSIWTAQDTTEVLYEQRLLYDGAASEAPLFLNNREDFVFPPNWTDNLCTQNGFIQPAGDGVQVSTVITTPHLGDFTVREGNVILHAMRVFDDAGIDEVNQVHSILAPGDSLRLDLAISLYEVEDGVLEDGIVLAGPSAHAGNASGTIHFLTDAVPYTRDWEVFESLDDPDTPVYNAFNQMLDLYPRVRYNALAIFDHTIWIRNDRFPPDSTGGWTLNNGNIAFVDHYASEGNRSCRMEIHCSDQCYIQQPVDLLAGEQVKARVDAYADSALAPGTPVTLTLASHDGTVSFSESFAVPVGQWTRLTLHLPGTPPVSGEYDFTISLGDAYGEVWFDRAAVLVDRPGEPATNLLSNPGFETGTAYLTYDSWGDEWWNAHGASCTATRCTEEYQQLMRDWDANNGGPSWQDRTKLGLHGGHHNASGDSVFSNMDPEFLSTPAEQRTAMESIAWHKDRIGLSDEMMRIFRFPHFRYTHVSPHLATEFGVEMLDYGVDVYNNHFYRTFTTHGPLWWNNSTWWADGGWGNGLWALNRTLSRGQFALLGAHPHATVTEYGAQWLHDIIGEMIDLHPHVAWEFSQDIIDRANAVSSLKDWRHDFNPNTGRLEMSFVGGPEIPVSLVCFHKDELAAQGSAWLDGGTECAVTTRGTRSFIELPPLEDGPHTVALDFIPESSVYETPGTDPAEPVFSYQLSAWPNPTNLAATVRWDANLTGPADLMLVNLLGQVVKRKELELSGAPGQWALNLGGVATGSYLLRIVHRQTGMTRTQRLSVVK